VATLVQLSCFTGFLNTTEEVRSLYGLPIFAPIEGVDRSAAKRRLKMANAVLTLLEFSASRASSLDKKHQIEAIFTW
jgi:hypothetical protein